MVLYKCPPDAVNLTHQDSQPSLIVSQIPAADPFHTFVPSILTLRPYTRAESPIEPEGPSRRKQNEPRRVVAAGNVRPPCQGQSSSQHLHNANAMNMEASPRGPYDKMVRGGNFAASNSSEVANWQRADPCHHAINVADTVVKCIERQGVSDQQYMQIRNFVACELTNTLPSDERTCGLLRNAISVRLNGSGQLVGCQFGRVWLVLVQIAGVPSNSYFEHVDGRTPVRFTFKAGDVAIRICASTETRHFAQAEMKFGSMAQIKRAPTATSMPSGAQTLAMDTSGYVYTGYSASTSQGKAASTSIVRLPGSSFTLRGMGLSNQVGPQGVRGVGQIRAKKPIGVLYSQPGSAYNALAPGGSMPRRVQMPRCWPTWRGLPPVPLLIPEAPSHNRPVPARQRHATHSDKPWEYLSIRANAHTARGDMPTHSRFQMIGCPSMWRSVAPIASYNSMAVKSDNGNGRVVQADATTQTDGVVGPSSLIHTHLQALAGVFKEGGTPETVDCLPQATTVPEDVDDVAIPRPAIDGSIGDSSSSAFNVYDDGDGLEGVQGAVVETANSSAPQANPEHSQLERFACSAGVFCDSAAGSSMRQKPTDTPVSLETRKASQPDGDSIVSQTKHQISRSLGKRAFNEGKQVVVKLPRLTPESIMEHARTHLGDNGPPKPISRPEGYSDIQEA